MLPTVVHARSTLPVQHMKQPSSKRDPSLHTAAPEQQFIHVMVICKCEFEARCFGTARKKSSSCDCTLKSCIIPLIRAAPVKCHVMMSSHNQLRRSVFILLLMSVSVVSLTVPERKGTPIIRLMLVQFLVVHQFVPVSLK